MAKVLISATFQPQTSPSSVFSIFDKGTTDDILHRPKPRPNLLFVSFPRSSPPIHLHGHRPPWYKADSTLPPLSALILLRVPTDLFQQVSSWPSCFLASLPTKANENCCKCKSEYSITLLIKILQQCPIPPSSKSKSFPWPAGPHVIQTCIPL